MPVRVTVALCTFNPAPELISRAVASVVSQLVDLGKVAAEFLVIDNNSDPPLAQAEFLRGLPLEILREERQGLTAAREAAIRRAGGDVLLFVDDDNVLHPGYLAGVQQAFEDPELGVLGGATFAEYVAEPPAWVRQFEGYLAIRPYPPDFVEETSAPPFTKAFPIGAGFAIRRSIAEAYVDDSRTRGRIEDRRGDELSSGEDLDIDLFALSLGYKLRVTGAISLTHVIPPRRTTERYLSALLTGGVPSSFAVDRKWSSRFERPIFEYFHRSAANARLRWVYHLLVSPFSVRSRLIWRRWNAILRVKRQAAAYAGLDPAKSSGSLRRSR